MEHQYAVLRCGGIPCGPFSMRPLLWPEPVAADVPALDGPDWQTLIPADTPDASFDIEVTRLVYSLHADPHAVAVALAERLSDEEWEHLLARWDAIRQVQRQYILDCPGCIPERLERQRWVSRLLMARPRVLAAATYARIRKAIAPEHPGQTSRAQTVSGSVSPALPVGSDVPVVITDPATQPNDRRAGTVTVVDAQGARRVPKFVHADRAPTKTPDGDTPAVDLFTSVEDDV
jgi:hypothetical protein